MNRDEIVAELFRLQDKKYAEMQTRIIPTVQPDRIIGVRTPELRTFAGSCTGMREKTHFCNPFRTGTLMKTSFTRF